MNRSEAMQIIKEENLKCYNWFHTHAVRPNEVLIENLGEQWCVSAAALLIHRASILTTKKMPLTDLSGC